LGDGVGLGDGFGFGEGYGLGDGFGFGFGFGEGFGFGDGFGEGVLGLGDGFGFLPGMVSFNTLSVLKTITLLLFVLLAAANSNIPAIAIAAIAELNFFMAMILIYNKFN
jgi:hypothetical protein